ncbi:QacE family quaternary ammonium compound efflux SMR transporter [Pseudonocardia sp. ICBG1122]|nr:SMR family transporter [Pseudonocardia sp. ICBG1293]NWJ69681.1 QacE family quaternary ammonium compound efflux SMR transporter [Pseudonocardia pini]
MKKWALLGGAIGAEVAATIALRATIDHTGWILVVAVGYVTAFVLLGLTLRTGMPIGIAYGIWGACGVALTALFGVLVFGEMLGLPAIIGIALIIGGVVLVETGSHHPESLTTEKAAA